MWIFVRFPVRGGGHACQLACWSPGRGPRVGDDWETQAVVVTEVKESEAIEPKVINF